MNYDFKNYKTENFFDEMITPEGNSREANQALKGTI